MHLCIYCYITAMIKTFFCKIFFTFVIYFFWRKSANFSLCHFFLYRYCLQILMLEVKWQTKSFANIKQCFFLVFCFVCLKTFISFCLHCFKHKILKTQFKNKLLLLFFHCLFVLIINTNKLRSISAAPIK